MKILLVYLKKGSAKFLAKKLRAFGHKVELSNYNKAVRKFLSSDYEAVIMRVEMKDCDPFIAGLEAYQKIKESLRPGQKLLMAGYLDCDEFEDEAENYLRLPAEVEDFLHKLKELK